MTYMHQILLDAIQLHLQYIFWGELNRNIQVKGDLHNFFVSTYYQRLASCRALVLFLFGNDVRNDLDQLHFAAVELSLGRGSFPIQGTP